MKLLQAIAMIALMHLCIIEPSCARNTTLPLQNAEVLKDTSTLFVYSFYSRKTVAYESQKSDVPVQTNACTGSDVILSAPQLGENTTFLWTGPAGFTAYSAEVLIRKVDFTKTGLYHVQVQNGDRLVEGSIYLKVKENPLVEIEKQSFNNEENLHLVAMDIGNDVSYRWLTGRNEPFALSRSVLLSKHSKGLYTYILEVEKDGCTVSKNFEIEVVDSIRR